LLNAKVNKVNWKGWWCDCPANNCRM